MRFKRFLILSSGSPHVRWCQTIYAILKESIIGKIHVSYMKFGPVVREEIVGEPEIQKMEKSGRKVAEF